LRQKSKLSKEDVIQKLPENIEMIGEYTNTITKTLFRCKLDGHEWMAKPLHIYRKDTGCPQCKINNARQRYMWTNEYFLEKLSEIRDDVEVLEEYKGSQKNIKCRCKKCQNIWFVAPCRLLKNVKCFYCSYTEDRSGENSYAWNPNLTEEDRIERRKLPLYQKFVNEVMERDNYTCQLTGDRKSHHNVHHLNGWDNFADERFDKHNAITLSENIHKEFHKQYGYGNNTKEQFYEFVDMLYSQGRMTEEYYNNFVKNFK
jgi:hypothetical protein